MDPTTPFQLILYHGAHILIGFVTNFGGDPQEIENFAKRLVENWCDDDDRVMEGFMDAVDNANTLR